VFRAASKRKLIKNRPIYLIGLTFEVPMRPASLYMTLTLRGLGFTTFQANLLSIPEKVGHSKCSY
jgi:MFS transporter, ACS family, DAL5 transporter family protein